MMLFWTLAAAAAPLALALPFHKLSGAILGRMDAEWGRSGRDWLEAASAPAALLQAAGRLAAPAPAPLGAPALWIAAASFAAAAALAVQGAAGPGPSGIGLPVMGLFGPGAPGAGAPGQGAVVAAARLALALGLFLAAICDLRARLLPDLLILPLLGLGLVLAGLGHGPAPAAACLGAAAGGGAFWALSAGYRALTGREGLGLGDAKLLALAGAWAGWQALPAIAFVATLLAAAQLFLAAGGRAGARTATPFGPALSLSLLIALGLAGAAPL